MDRLARWKLLRVATIVLLVVAVGLGGWKLFNGGAKATLVKAQSGEITVLDGVANDHSRNSAVPVTVRGYVFSGPYGLLLCNGKKSTSPPSCIGPTIDLQGADARALALRSATKGGKRVLWSDRPIAVLGHLEAGQMTVSQVMP